ncbi:class I SAM-dependent rRNA methyltransferase [Acutalibacter sp. LFL-21]|uniref:class I SAM-dependent rRNA methyltransferase n=1 Tax=Acutalibacter sp. LFL-21 TaxID=2983399 RepID=UPI0021D69D68|nr:class I SAM-dependent rRNA methyltransferase [Acutalibacter sp. LFL-21]MCU7653625.1 class I SAM-dependent rRNA methyltransferase [Acutalibacter sp. LFL-21]
MKSDRPYPFVTIDARGAKRAQQGHPWVFDNEITAQEGALEDGALCDVRSPKGRYLGTGYYNSHSKIRVRLLSQNANDKFDQAFFARRAQYAWDYRKTVMGPDAGSCRVIFGEADRFPGLTVDKFGDILVTQTLCLGTELRKGWIFPALVQAIEAGGEHIRGIYERNDVKIRELEGMEQNKGWYPLEGKPLPESTQTEIVENGIRYLVDFENGQKTGFFLDQKYNRAAAARIAPGRAVLDCFTHTGSFGLNCAKAGAKRVHSVDVSETAIACAKENAARNGLSVEYEVANVFDLLPNLTPGEYDYIILDPPAFTKSGKTVKNAERGYKEINYRAMKSLPRGGYLATCSCSHFMTDALFRKMLQSAASDAQVELRLVEARAQGPDHPVLWNVPETDYLKFYIFQVV